MAALFKHIYNEQFINEYGEILTIVSSNFDSDAFRKSIFTPVWEQLELKARMRHITHALNTHIKGNFKEQTSTLLKTISFMKLHGRTETSIEFMFVPDFIEVYGIDDYATAINAFETITQFTSCEFAVRPFILKYPSKMMAQMLIWADHPHPMVRRLASEGCRPRLPWAMALPPLKKDPSPILQILSMLKEDSSESVRRSVANNLNDISKDNPELVLSLAKKWMHQSKQTDWLVKHACRTLLKQGAPEVMRLFGFGAVQDISIEQFNIITPNVSIGNSLEFEFQLVNTSKTPIKLRLEYAIYYQKANTSLAKKVFKISEKMYEENSRTKVNRKQSFKLITTRKFHVGTHKASIIVNGVEFPSLPFTLTS